MVLDILAFTDWLKPETIILYGGLALLLFVIFAETGLFFGFFLPGDSLLFIAGLFCGTEYLRISIASLIALLILAAVLGTTIGYGFGYWAEPYLRNRNDNFFYKKKYLEMTREFYARHGMMAFILGRFLPIVRTFVPILAGIARIDFKNFLFYNIMGASLWICMMTLSGHWLGNIFPGITDHLEIIIISMILLSAVPVLLSWYKQWRVAPKENIK